jgi:hypothetical protein
MNWYKQAQIEQADLIADYESYIEDSNSDEEVINLIQRLTKDFEIIDFDGDRIISAIINGTHVIIELGGYYEVQEPVDWIQNIANSGNAYRYVDERDFNKEFWDDVSDGFMLYHGTGEERFDDIIRNGLESRDETRGISNRGTGSAVFTSDDPGTPRNHYDKVIEINVGQMKRDGYMPTVGKEGPLEEAELIETLAHKIGLEDFYYEVDSSDGLSHGTVIFYNDIPARYLREAE